MMGRLVFWTLIGVVFSSPAHAYTWERVLTCDGGSAYLEVAKEERRILQFVVTDHNIANYLSQNSFVKAMPDTGDFVISGGTANGVFSSAQFSSMSMGADDGLGYPSYANVEREGEGIFVHFRTEDHHSGYGQNYDWPGNWHFKSCL